MPAVRFCMVVVLMVGAFAVGCCMVCVCYGCTGGLRGFGVDFGVLTFRVCGWVWVRWFTLFGFEFVGLLNL